MNTPICDFVRHYAGEGSLRLHMPGHKGQTVLGPEALDITEISGADVLYSGSGIIRESENNASRLFGSGRTLYSTEGSSLSIRAMIRLAMLYARSEGLSFTILAARNAHKTFISAAALLDTDIRWIYPDAPASLLACPITADALKKAFSAAPSAPCAVYITSPDYLGHLQDIATLAEVCHAHHALLLVDNAHGAYLHFLPEPVHPLDLGADLVCDSAHKTLPVLTGGAYLHLASSLPDILKEAADSAMQLFASTSPSYLILQSLDAANVYLEEILREQLRAFLPGLQKAKARLADMGFSLAEEEPLKITLDMKPFGYTGDETARFLEENGLVCEFSDPDYLVMMLSPAWQDNELERILSVLSSLPRRAPLLLPPPAAPVLEKVMTVRQAVLGLSEEVPVNEADGRILSFAHVMCPPAVPIAVPGEQLDRTALNAMHYYGISRCSVLCEVSDS